MQFDSEQITVVITAIVSALAGGFGTHHAMRRVRVSNDPLNVREHRDPTWAEVQGIERRLEVVEREVKEIRARQIDAYNDLTEKGEQRANRIMKAVAESAGKIHARVDEVARQVYILAGKSIQ